MKNIIIVFVLLLTGFGTKAQEIPLIPKPVKAVKQSSAFTLNQHTQIIANKEASKIAEYLQTELLKFQGISLRSTDKANANYIDLQLKPNAKQALEAYQLLIGENKIELKAAHPQGLFAGVTSLLQLIRQQQAKNNQINRDTFLAKKR